MLHPINKTLALNEEEINKAKELNKIKGFEYVTGKNLIEAQSSLNEEFGTSVVFSKEIAGEFADIQTSTGLSN